MGFAFALGATLAQPALSLLHSSLVPLSRVVSSKNVGK